MKSDDLLDMIGDASGKHVWDAQQVRIGKKQSKKKPILIKRIWLIAAVVALMLTLMGCTVAYVQGWFTEFFSSRSSEPLSDSQIEYIENHEQIVVETYSDNGWTIELKSTMCDGDTGYIMFGITAPEDIDLEGYFANEKNLFAPRVTPGNHSWGTEKQRPLTVASIGNINQDQNYYYMDGGCWTADNDGRGNTLDYVVSVRCEKLNPQNEMLLKEPFGSDVSFKVQFLDFRLDYEDQEVSNAIEEEHAGEEYMVDADGLFKSDLLVEGQWEFNVTFADTPESIELITEPVQTWALVTWKLDDEPTFYKTSKGIAPVKIVSFVLYPFRATVEYEFEEPAFGAFIEYQAMPGYEDRFVYVVMKDGTQIPLHTAGEGSQLAPDSPIVLDEVDYVLLGDGVKLEVSK